MAERLAAFAILIVSMMSESAGYARVVDAEGGIRAWLAAGQPVTPCPSC